MNRPEFETQEEWRNGVQAGPWWREIDWRGIACVVAGAVVGYLLWWLT